jgi:hypothetical protein
MLIELGQLVCSCGLSDVYKPINQGKELQVWVNTHRAYTYSYFDKLLRLSKSHVNMTEQTLSKLEQIGLDLKNSIGKVADKKLTHAYFRYNKNYVCSVVSKSLLPIDDCIAEYKKYLEWKINA